MNIFIQFTSKQNLALLWEVLLDELNINLDSNKILVSNIKTVFESNIKPFTTRANPTLGIMELNKLFLSQVLTAVHRLFPTIKQNQTIKRITITDEEVLEPYKIEDIHASRQNDFEKEVERKRIEMENYMTPQKPKELDFSDKNLDGRIKSMDSLVADKMAQRNIEIEHFQNSNYNTSSINPETWLTPKETSVKNEKTHIESKVIEQKPIIKHNQNNNTRLKHISIDNNNNITLSIDELEKKTHNSVKKVSWDDDSQDISLNIFSKLKKQPFQSQDDNTNDKKQYIEQQSMQLPEVKQEEIIRNQITLPTSSNEPVIPKTEIIKQLNEMNKKIDNLYEIILKLTTIVEKNNMENEDKSLEITI